MSLDLSARPLKVHTLADCSKKVKYHDTGILPSHPGRVLFVAPSQSGKSNFLLSLLCDSRYLRGFYDKIIVCSPTAEADKQYDTLRATYPEHKLEWIDDFNPEVLMDVMQEHINLVKAQGPASPRTLLILDDCAASDGLNRISPLYMKCRHGNMSVWTTTQAYTGIPSKQRMQASNIFIWGVSPSELERLANEYSTIDVDKHKLKAFVHEATKEKYGFLNIDKQHDSKHMFRKSLDEYFIL